MKTVIIAVVAVAVIIGSNVWAAGKDKERIQANEQYAQCVKDQYGMSPTQWYAQFNEFPVCGQ